MHVIINGVSSETLQGVQVLSLPPITKPRMRTSVAVIDGRPGDIVTRLGYEAYNRKIQILLHHDYDIDAIIAFFNTSGTIIFSNEPDMEYEFETIDAFSFERAVRYKTADITFHVQSYKLSATEQPATGEVSTLVDKTPYIIRRTPAGTRQKGTIVGGSIVWNQLIENGDFADTTGWQTSGSSLSVSNNVATVTPSAAKSCIRRAVTRNVGHKYFATCQINGQGTGYFAFYGGAKFGSIALNGAWSVLSTITEAATTANTRLDVGVDDNANLVTYQIKNVNFIDLTLMFGPTIADYIYTQEQASAGAGVAFFRSLFDKPYYPYSAGEIKSVEGLTAHKTTGCNQWDEEWEVGSISQTSGANASSTTEIRSKNYTPIFPNTAYYFKTPETYTQNLRCRFYDASKNYIGTGPTINPNREFTTPPDAYFMRFVLRETYGTTYNNDICLNISSDKNGTYEPYTAHEYPLDSSLTLRGLPKLDGDNLYYDGDIYPPSGEVKRRYKRDDLATITWQKRKTGTVNDGYSASLSSYYKAINADYTPPFLCDKYEAIGATNTNLLTTNVDTMEVGLYGFRYNGNTTVVYLVVPTGSTISGNLVYELAEPTTEQAEPYTELQICDPDGTEEWVGASMPVGHETTYIDPISMTVTNEGNTESAPSITIEGEGTVEVTVDGLNILQIQMPSSGEITIDSRTLDATDGEGGLANRSVVGDYNDLRLAPGEHTVTVTGDVTSVTIKNASRWI